MSFIWTMAFVNDDTITFTQSPVSLRFRACTAMLHSREAVGETYTSIHKFRIYSRPFDILRGKYPRKVIRVRAKGNLVLVLSQARWTFSRGIIGNSALDFYRARVKATKLASSRYSRQSLLYKKQHFFRIPPRREYLHFKRILPYPYSANVAG